MKKIVGISCLSLALIALTVLPVTVSAAGPVQNGLTQVPTMNQNGTLNGNMYQNLHWFRQMNMGALPGPFQNQQQQMFNRSLNQTTTPSDGLDDDTELYVP